MTRPKVGKTVLSMEKDRCWMLDSGYWMRGLDGDVYRGKHE